MPGSLLKSRAVELAASSLLYRAVRSGTSIWLAPLPLALFLLTWIGLVYGHGTEKHGSQSGSEAAAEPVVLAPGYEPLEFDAPEPGSYKLPVIGLAADGKVLDSDGQALTLASLMEEKITVLSFIYRACNDVNGCPLATFVLNQVRNSVAGIPGLAESVRLISMSFDPANDSPEAMADYKNSFPDSPVDWRFVTASSTDELRPVLSDYNQPLSEAALADGSATINHMLRVFLIDGAGQIRNIYSATLLHGETLFSDIQTLALEQGEQLAVATTAKQVLEGSGAGSFIQPEDRSGYASGSYTSRSNSVQQQGLQADLMALSSTPVVGLPMHPAIESLTADKIELGRRLFYDRRLSINDTFSCAMCHIPQQAFTSNELATSVGVEGRTVKRNAPSLLNVAYLSSLFHDGRESTLEQQVWSPLLADNEMDNPSIGYVLEKIAGLKGYPMLFEKVYQDSRPTMQSLGDALSAYQRSLISANSKFDQWYFSGDSTAMSDAAQRGFAVFSGKGGCIACHTVESDHALFTDEKLHNTGVGYLQSTASRDQPHEVTLAPGVVVMVDPESYAAAAEPVPVDLGRYEVTLNPADRWKFRTPGLRNVSLTAPYMHNGSLSSLSEVVDFYDSGGIANPELSPLMKPLNLTEGDKADLVEFMQSLVGDSIELLASDGVAAPIGDLVKP